MALKPDITLAESTTPESRSRRFTLDEYHALYATGALPRDEKTDLIDGVIYLHQPDTEPIPRRFTLEEYHRAYELGALRTNERVELIQGEIIVMSPVGKWHISKVNYFTHTFSRLLGETAIVSVQNPIRLPNSSEPEPDLSILRFRPDFYEENVPAASDTLLIVEVSDSTYYYDVVEKMQLYASAGIPEAWIIDLNRERIIQHTEPTEGGYQRVRYYRRGTVVTSTLLEAITIPLDSVFKGPTPES